MKHEAIASDLGLPVAIALGENGDKYLEDMIGNGLTSYFATLIDVYDALRATTSLEGEDIIEAVSVVDHDTGIRNKKVQDAVVIESFTMSDLSLLADSLMAGPGNNYRYLETTGQSEGQSSSLSLG